MTVKEAIQSQLGEFSKIHERLQSEYGKLRSGRASSAIVDNVMIDYYGTPTPLKQAANITIPEARQILIQPWDKSILELIAATLNKSDLGLSPSNDGNAVRITLPPMTEENRKELVKVMNQKTEEARIAVRGVRETLIKDLQKQEKDGVISEDDLHAGREEIQKAIDEHNKQIEQSREAKEKDILTV